MLRPAIAPGEDRNITRWREQHQGVALRPAIAPGEDRNTLFPPIRA